MNFTAAVDRLLAQKFPGIITTTPWQWCDDCDMQVRRGTVPRSLPARRVLRGCVYRTCFQVSRTGEADSGNPGAYV